MICPQCPQGRAVSDCISPGSRREGPGMALGSPGRGQGEGSGSPMKSPGRTQEVSGRAQGRSMVQGGYEGEGKEQRR